MGAVYLTDMTVWLAAAGLTVVEYPGWQTRARGSGGYEPGRPWAVMFHHTASMSDPDQDAGYIATGDEDAPLANLLVDRAGVVWVIAAGATNTNGACDPFTFSRGTVPRDQMNTHAVGMEIANNGVGEPYPPAQIDAALTASLAICEALGLDPTDAAQHHDISPGRKIDPARADAVQGPWRPAAVNSSGSWSLIDLRGELAARAGGWTPAPIPPTLEDDDMLIACLDANGTMWIGDGMRRRMIGDPTIADNVFLVHRGRLVNVSGGACTGWDTIGSPVGGATLEALGAPDD